MVHTDMAIAQHRDQDLLVQPNFRLQILLIVCAWNQTNNIISVIELPRQFVGVYLCAQL